jgi:hypothetical protein
VLTGLLLCNAARPARSGLLLWVSSLPLLLLLLLLLLLWVSSLPLLLLLLLLWLSSLPLLLLLLLLLLWVSSLPLLLLLLLLWVSCLPLLLLLLLWVSCLPLLLQPSGGGCRSLLAPCLPLLLAFTSLTLPLPPVNLLRLQQRHGPRAPLLHDELHLRQRNLRQFQLGPQQCVP